VAVVVEWVVVPVLAGVPVVVVVVVLAVVVVVEVQEVAVVPVVHAEVEEQQVVLAELAPWLVVVDRVEVVVVVVEQ
jgi:hypothetical protein